MPDNTETGFASSEAERKSPVAVTTTSSECVPVMHFELDLHLVAAGHGDRLVCRAEGGDRDDDEVGARRDLVEPERAVGGDRGADAESGNARHREGDPLAVGVDAAGDGAGLLGGGCCRDEKGGKGE